MAENFSGKKIFRAKRLDRIFLPSFSLFVCLSVGLFACLFVCMFVRLFACLFVCPYVCLFVRMFVCFVCFGKEVILSISQADIRNQSRRHREKNFYFKEIFCLCLFFQEVKNGVKGFDCHQQNCWQISNFEEIASSLMDP